MVAWPKTQTSLQLCSRTHAEGVDATAPIIPPDGDRLLASLVPASGNDNAE